MTRWTCPAEPKLHFRASPAAQAQAALERLVSAYGQHTLADADLVVALGGDGHMLDTLHRVRDAKPVFGLNRGTVGFLLNSYAEHDLVARIQAAREVIIKPLVMRAECMNGQSHAAEALNEVALFRETRQTAQLRIFVDGRVRLDRLACDGALLCTPAGSTAYNLSAHGPIIPLRSRLLGLTPISAFRPRRWRGALLSDEVRVRFEVLEPTHRPVSVTADSEEFRDVRAVEVHLDQNAKRTLLFDPGTPLEERILQEQFTEDAF